MLLIKRTSWRWCAGGVQAVIPGFFMQHEAMYPTTQKVDRADALTQYAPSAISRLCGDDELQSSINLIHPQLSNVSPAIGPETKTRS